MAEPNPVLDRILSALQGAGRVLDVGCGAGALSAALARRGFAVTGIDPQAEQIAQARRAHPEATFLVATAQAIPALPQPQDAAVFLNALHHVPAPAMAEALGAVLGTLRPGGVMIVVEPLAQGSFFAAMQPVDDETRIRAAALAALDDLKAAATCTLLAEDRFDRTTAFADLEAFLAYLRAADPARAAMIATHRDAVAAAFATHAVAQGNGFILTQPMAIWVFQTFAEARALPSLERQKEFR